jgi:hypothetical protein
VPYVEYTEIMNNSKHDAEKLAHVLLERAEFFAMNVQQSFSLPEEAFRALVLGQALAECRRAAATNSLLARDVAAAIERIGSLLMPAREDTLDRELRFRRKR